MIVGYGVMAEDRPWLKDVTGTQAEQVHKVFFAYGRA
jgi:hypothetical protein